MQMAGSRVLPVLWLLPLPELKAAGPNGGAIRFRFRPSLRRTFMLLISSAVDAETIWRPPNRLLAVIFFSISGWLPIPEGRSKAPYPHISMFPPFIYTTVANCATETEHLISLKKYTQNIGSGKCLYV